jgi:hypothetical protein
MLAIVPSARGEGPEPEQARLRRHVEVLASPEYGGRRGEGGRKAADYLVDAFRKLGLEPLFDGGFTQEIPGREPGSVAGHNVGAKLVGSDPTLKDRWIIVSAHFDHLGVREGVLYPGADDNASGVAMMLEVARSLVEGAERPRRSVMFVGFDLEEVGLFGSRYFVEHSPVPLDRIALFLTADMIGGALGGVCEAYLFVMGSEHAPGLRPWVERASAGRPVTVALLGSDVIDPLGPVTARSDYGPFRNRKVPYLFFSTGEGAHYHSPGDTAETLDYPKVEANSRIILGIVREAASADEVPAWSDPPEYAFSEIATMREVLGILLAHRADLNIGGTMSTLMANTLRKLDAILARGTVTPAERAGLVRVARVILYNVL